MKDHLVGLFGFLAVTATTVCGIPTTLAAEPSLTPKFTELSAADMARLDRQRAVVATSVKQRYGGQSLTKTKADVPILQRLLDDHTFAKGQTYELQSMGVAFGDVLASELGLRWMMVTDEYGTDPTLRLAKTTIQINALTMISKRVERGDVVDLSRMLTQAREALAKARADLK